MVLAGDIGGTKSLLGLFDPIPALPRALEVCAQHARLEDLQSMALAFLEGSLCGGQGWRRPASGVVGPVVGDSARLTNVPCQEAGLLGACCLCGEPMRTLRRGAHGY